MKTMRTATMNILNREEGYHERTEGIVRMMTAFDVDAICLQETRVDSVDDFAGVLDGAGYDVAFRGDTTGKRGDTVAVAWKRATLKQADRASSMYGVDAVRVPLAAVDDGSIITMVSYHGAWGYNRQRARLREVSAMAKALSTSVSTTVLAGDFNAEPGERAIRYLMGLDEGMDENDWTFWMEAQEVMDSISGCGTSATTIRTGQGATTAMAHGIRPYLLPERRIDYIFSEGYAFGKRGGFSDVSVIDGYGDGDSRVDADSLSDHRMVVATMMTDEDSEARPDEAADGSSDEDDAVMDGGDAGDDTDIFQ